jgi:hypothetical protein
MAAAVEPIRRAGSKTIGDDCQLRADRQLREQTRLHHAAFAGSTRAEQTKCTATRLAAIEPAFGQIAFPDADIEAALKEARTALARLANYGNSRKTQNGPSRGLAV